MTAASRDCWTLWTFRYWRHSPKTTSRRTGCWTRNYYWQKVGSFAWSELRGIADSGGALWRNGHHTRTSSGRNDRIPLSEARLEDHSLKLIHVDAMDLCVFAPGSAFGNAKRRVQAQFRFSDTDYHLWVTDPRIARDYLARADGEYPFGACCLTVSLGEPYRGYCYKLVAAVLERPG